MKRMIWGMMIAASLILTVVPLLAGDKTSEEATQRLAQKVRHELILLPYYDVFDNLAFRVEDGVVTLVGQVRRPTLRSDAERVVKRIEGVAEVRNEVEVLPLSSFDDRIRLGVLRAVYGHSALARYNLGAIAPIRIVMKNGHVTLEGVVASEMDRNIAFVAANGVSGAFSVTNNLKVARETA